MMFTCPLLVGVLLGSPSEITVVYGEASFITPYDEKTLVSFFESKGIVIDPKTVDTVVVPRLRCDPPTAVAMG